MSEMSKTKLKQHANEKKHGHLNNEWYNQDQQFEWTSHHKIILYNWVYHTMYFDL